MGHRLLLLLTLSRTTCL